MAKMDFLVVVWGANGERPERYDYPDEEKHFDSYNKMKKYLESDEAQKHWDNEVCFNKEAWDYIKANNL